MTTTPEPDLHHRPHSRACGITRHDHGPECHSNCPTCGGRPVPEPEPDDLDPAVYSDTSINDPESPTGWRRLTWREVAEERQREVLRLQGFQTIVTDLDRNANGRHEGDADVGAPGGVSQGNPLFTTGDVVGYQLGGHPYLMPPRGKRHDPAAWKAGW